MSKPNSPTQKGYRMTSKYGWRTHPIRKTRSFHGGLDFAPAKAGTRGWKIYAMRDGEIIQTGYHSIMGKYVIIKHRTDQYVSLYQHLEKIYYNKGKKVKQGQEIGVMGTTGSSTGIHLHLVIGTGYPINQGANGNTIDPLKYMSIDNGGSKRRTLKLTSPMMNGSDVKEYQQALANKYFYPDKKAKNNGIDGWFGKDTRNATMRFQAMNGLVPDGIAGSKTFDKLGL